MLKINPAIFKAYDIRGIYNEDFDDHLAYLLGQAFVELRKRDNDLGQKKLTIAIAYDMRLSSPALKNNLINGLTKAGANVVDLGLIATPTFYFAVGHYKYDGGIMISASHNPKEWNGFKMVRSKAEPVSGETGIDFLKELVLKNNFNPSMEQSGVVTKNNNALEDSIKYALSFTKDKKIKPLKIVVDTANGMGAVYLKELFNKLNLDYIALNFDLDGSFPAHEADPLKEENLKDLQIGVKANQADLGIATDGDGDRIFFIDNLGNIVDPAIVRGLMAKLFLLDKPGSKIGYDVRPGKITVDLIKENGGQAIVTRVGHSLIKEQMIKEEIYFAGESSGHFYFNGDAGCFEYPKIMIIKLLLLLSQSEKTLTEIVSPYKKYFHSGEINKSVIDKELVFNKIKHQYRDGDINLLDGVSVTYDDFWFNVRGSNTEAKIRLNLEAKDQKTMIEKTKEVLELIN